jgi:hypothetical protein
MDADRQKPVPTENRRRRSASQAFEILLVTTAMRRRFAPLLMSWKRAQNHAELMLQNLGLGKAIKGRKDLRDKRVVFVDDGTNEYRTMCFTIAAKIVKKRGAEVENVKPEPGEAPHAKVVDLGKPERPKPSRSPGALRRSLRE